MTRPLRYIGGNLQEMSDAQMEYSAHRILENFAASNSGTGTVNLNGAGTTFGTFVDTFRTDNVGDHPVLPTAIGSSSVNLNQDLSAAIENSTRPIKYTGGNLQEQSNTDLDNHIISIALNKLAAGGVGSYRIEPSSPTVGGTWSAIGTITDTSKTGNATTTLWRKTADTVPSTFRPMKALAGGNIQEMSDADIQTLCERMRNRIIATGIGQYALSPTAPGGGTWVSVGNIFTDTRQEVANVAYSGNYTGTYSGAYAGNYTLFFGGVSYGTFTGFYTGFYTGTYTGFYTGLTVQATKETVNSYRLWIRTA